MDKKATCSKKKDRLIYFIYLWFGVHSFFWLQSAIIYVVQDNDKWFSRITLALFCQGIFSLIYVLRNNNKTGE